MKAVVFWSRGRAAAARARADEGAQILPWSAAGEEELRGAGVPFTPLADLLGQEDRDAIDEAAIAWTKAWGKQPLEDGVSFRDRLRWKGVSLWWFAELFLHHSTRAPALVRTIETMLRVLERLRPDEAEAVGLPAEEALLLARACSVQRVLFLGQTVRARPRPAWRVSVRSRWNTVKTVLGAAKTALGAAPAAPAGVGQPVLFLSHAAFWRRRDG